MSMNIGGMGIIITTRIATNAHGSSIICQAVQVKLNFIVLPVIHNYDCPETVLRLIY